MRMLVDRAERGGLPRDLGANEWILWFHCDDLRKVRGIEDEDAGVNELL